ncbi:MAG: O-antigen ligase family protein [Methylococcaceae bacterium]|nr:O-antigen ligase family protein [Methylococcaceae bacterium]
MRWLYIYLTALSVFYFAHLPLHIAISKIGIPNEVGFISLVAITLMLYFLRLLEGKEHDVSVKLRCVLYSLPFSMYAGISYFVSGDYLNDIQNVLVLCFVNPVFIFFGVISSNHKNRVYFATIILASMYFIFITYLKLTGQLVTPKGQAFLNIFDSGNEYQNIGIFMGLFIVLMTAKLIKTPFILQLPLLLIILASFYYMLLVGCRSAIVSLVFVLLFWWLYGGRIYRYYITASICFLGVVLSWLLDLSWIKLVAHSNFLAVSRFMVLANDNDASSREFLFSKAIELFTLNIENILLGAGINYYPIYIGEHKVGYYPHNIILELLAEFGTIGTLFFMIPIGYLLIKRYVALGAIVGKNDVEKTAFFIFFYLFIINMFTGGLRASWMIVFFLFLLYPQDSDVGKKNQYTYSIKNLPKIWRH